MNDIRWLHRATVLPSGKVLVTGGQSAYDAFRDAQFQ
jgi:hypothetical protein